MVMLMYRLKSVLKWRETMLKNSKVVYFCPLKKFVRPKIFGPYYVYPLDKHFIFCLLSYLIYYKNLFFLWAVPFAYAKSLVIKWRDIAFRNRHDNIILSSEFTAGYICIRVVTNEQILRINRKNKLTVHWGNL